MGALALGAAVLWQLRAPEVSPSPPFTSDAATRDRGAYLVRLGNCAGCHTARGGEPFAGGRGVVTPFGTVVAGNLTPDDGTGLGRWTPDDFWRAMHHGRSRDGRLLSPAFPYSEFTKVRREDTDAIYVYLRSLQAVKAEPPASSLRFPFNTQAALAVWRLLYFRPSTIEAASTPVDRSAPWQRGAYLVQGLGHCASCHAPRNALGAIEGADRLAGGAMPMQSWFAPDLTPSGAGSLESQQQSIVDLLRSGMSARGTAGGPMAEVVMASTQHWSDDDLSAVAVYLTSLPAQRRAPTRHEPPSPGVAEQVKHGQTIYADQCLQCHGEQGEGAPGIYPPLAGNPTVTLADANNVLQVIRHGGFAPATRASPRPFGMPPASLSPQALADVATYIRQAWGNTADAVTVLEAMRAP